MKFAASLLCLVLLTGCIGGGDEEEPVAPADTNDAGAPASTSSSTSPSPKPASPTPAASRSSNSTTTANPTPAASSDAAAAPAPELVTLPYEWTGGVVPEICIGLAPSCVGLLANEGWFDMPALDGAPVSAKLELVWTPEATGIAEMRFVLLRATACEGDGCWQGEPIVQMIGASPLVIESDFELGDGEFLVVAARAASMLPEPLYGFVHTEQSFTATGQFVVAR